MADDIRLVIGVEQSGLLKAITNTESLETKVKKLSAAYAREAVSYGKYNKAIGDLAKATKRNKKELLDYGTALRADEKATKKAKEETKRLANEKKKAAIAARDLAAEQRKAAIAARDLAAEQRKAAKATEDLARAEAKNAASLKSMRMATDSVYRNQQKRLQMKKLLRAAIASETMTTEQAIVALKRYNAAQMSSTKVMGASKNKMNGMNMAIQQAGYQFGDFAVQVQGGTSAFVAFSQQGAQLAGMLPNIAGPLGMSMKMAVGLSAAFGVLIPVGSAIGRMFFEMWGSAKDATDTLKELDKAQDSLTDAIKDANTPLGELIDKYGDYSSVIKEVYLAKLNDHFLDAKLAMENATTALDGFLEAYSRISSVDRIGVKLGIKAEGPRGQRYTQEQRGGIRDVKDLFGQIYGATTPEEQLQLLEELREKLTNLGADVNNFPELKVSTFSEYLIALADLDVALTDAEASSKGLSASTSDAYKRSSGAADDLARAISQNNQEMSRNLELSKGETDVINNVMGAEDALGKLRATYARADYLSKMLSKGLSDDELTNAMYQYDALVEQLKVKKAANEAAIREQDALDKSAADALEREERRQNRNASVTNQIHRVRQNQQREAREEQTRINALEAEVSEYAKNNNWEKTQLQKTTQQILTDAIEVHKQEKAIREELGDAAVEALKLAGVDITSGVDAAAKAAAILAGNLGMSFETARDIMLLGGKGVSGPSGAQYSSQDKVVEGQVGDRVGGLYGVVGQLSVGGGSGSSGGGSNAVKEDAFEKLTKELSRRKELLSLSKERAVVTRAIWSLEDSLGKSRAKYSAEEIKALVEKNIALKKTEDALEAARSKQESLAESIASSMGDALMGIVDGTMTVKDAFRSMARDIIKQLYQVIVVQRLVGSAEAGKESGLAGFIIKGLSSINANGNVFSGGSQVQAYANGGVVGGPTYFPMSGGKTGLMGEAGPEAIMPLKRGANGKLGVQMEGGGNTTVVQNFNFSANGDDSVKKIIAQAAPQIANMTKKSIMDDRRRGGQMKATFG